LPQCHEDAGAASNLGAAQGGDLPKENYGKRYRQLKIDSRRKRSFLAGW